MGCAGLKAKEPRIQETKFFFKVLQSERILKGGKLLIVPFTAGVNIEANEELKKVALMIVKGITEAIQEKNESRFELLFFEEAGQAQLVIEGHITKLTSPSRISQMGLGDKKISLGVEGDMVDLETGEKILIFNDERKADRKTSTYQDLAYGIGRSIGNALMAQ